MVHLNAAPATLPAVRPPAVLSRYWRLAATGLSFAIFGIGGLTMAFLYFPAVNLLVRNKAKRAALAQASVHAMWRVYIELMRILGVLTYETENIDVLRNCRGTVVVANHPSLLDVVFLMAFMRHTRAVVKEGVWRNPFMSGVVRSSNYIPNLNDPEALIENCAEALREGSNLCIFPEGTRTPIGQKTKYQRGFAYVALKAEAPILLVTIEVTPPTLRKGEPWHSIPATRPHWRIRVHNQIDTCNIIGEERTVQAVRRLAREVQSRIEEELGI